MLLHTILAVVLSVVSTEASKDRPETEFGDIYLKKISQANLHEWPKGIIPYLFDTQYYDNVLLINLNLAMSVVEAASCIKFKRLDCKPSDSSNWLHITNPSGETECVHHTKPGSMGEIILVFGLKCLRQQDVLHTLMHGVGFHDEVTHPERDKYVRVLWDNIHTENRELFHIRRCNTTTTLVEYDPVSVMNFHENAYSINGQPTIKSMIRGLKIQPSNSLSLLDKMKLRLLFNHECNKRNIQDIIALCKYVLHPKSKKLSEIKENSAEVAKISKKEEINNSKEESQSADEEHHNSNEEKYNANEDHHNSNEEKHNVNEEHHNSNVEKYNANEEHHNSKEELHSANEDENIVNEETETKKGTLHFSQENEDGSDEYFRRKIIRH